MVNTDRNKAILSKYIPSEAVETVAGWIIQYDIKLKIRKSRTTKLGDYTSPHEGKNHTITVNHDLNPFSFLITFVHEVAHLTNWMKHKNRVYPHGAEWKQEFKVMMQPFLNSTIFPPDVTATLHRYMQDPAASSCSDLRLMRVLSAYDKKTDVIHLEKLAYRTQFQFGKNKTFIKGEKIRTRYKCLELTTKRTYLFHPMAEVKPISLE